MNRKSWRRGTESDHVSGVRRPSCDPAKRDLGACNRHCLHRRPHGVATVADSAAPISPSIRQSEALAERVAIVSRLVPAQRACEIPSVPASLILTSVDAACT